MPTARDIVASIPGAFNNDDFMANGEPTPPEVYTIEKAFKKEFKGNDGSDVVKTCLGFKETSKYLVLSKSRGSQLLEVFPDGEVEGGKVKLRLNPLFKVNNKVTPSIVIEAP